MESKWEKRVLSGLLMLVIVLSCVSPASAAASSADFEKEYVEFVTSTLDYPNGIHAITTVYTHTDYQFAVPGTRAELVPGAELTIMVNQTTSETVTASQNFGYSDTTGLESSLGVSYGFEATTNTAFSTTITQEVGLAYSETCSVQTGVSYTLGSDMEPGIYYIALVFPGKTVTKEIVGIDKRGFESILWNETVDYAPRANYSYFTLLQET